MGHLVQGGPLLGSNTNAIICNPLIFSAMTMAMSIYRKLCVLLIKCSSVTEYPRKKFLYGFSVYFMPVNDFKLFLMRTVVKNSKISVNTIDALGAIFAIFKY